jgi:GAF domain-containing protein
VTAVESSKRSARARLEILLAVSRLVADTEQLDETLDLIAREAARAVDAFGATIVLISGPGRLRLGGAWGLREVLRHRVDADGFVNTLPGPTQMALTERRQIVIDDLAASPDYAEWTRAAAVQLSGALTSNPIGVDDELVGTLTVYRERPGPWAPGDLELLSFLADHAGSALRIAHLIERQNRRLAGIDLVTRRLREQTHEHANRVHSIAALIAMGEVEEARRFVADQLEAHAQSHEALIAGIEPAAACGLLLAEMANARQRGIELVVEPGSTLTRVPAGMSEAELVALLGQLLQHALEAVAHLQPHQQRVVFSAASGTSGATFRVTDSGVPEPDAAALDDDRRLRSLTTSALTELVAAAGGTVVVEPRRGGNTTTVTLPG